MPRGTIHQAVAGSEGSSHVTLSTYQNWAIGDFALRMLQVRAAPSFLMQTPAGFISAGRHVVLG
jgi:hypothetical protein